MSDEKQEVLYAEDGHVAIITLNAPERMNTISAEMTNRLSELLISADEDSNIRAIVLTAAGTRAFCAGLDLRPRDPAKPAASNGNSSTRLYLRNMPPAVMTTIDTPVICAVNGAAAGYGLDLTLGADMRIMGESGKLSTTFVRRGLLPESGCTWLLPRLIGWEKAADLLMVGRTLGGKECVEWGLARQCVADDALLDTAVALAHEVALNAPLAVQAAKRMMRMGLEEPLPQHMHHVYMQLRALMATDDTKEGLAAFLEKRDPVFNAT